VFTETLFYTKWNEISQGIKIIYHIIKLWVSKKIDNDNDVLTLV
jgi:hypothetical protein